MDVYGNITAQTASTGVPKLPEGDLDQRRDLVL
jgi:hypothetical protein